MPSCGKVATSTVFHSIWRISVWQPPVLQGGSVAVRFPCKSSGVLPWLSQWEKDLLGDREWAMHIDFQLNAALVYPFFFWFSRTCKGATIWCCSATTSVSWVQLCSQSYMWKDDRFAQEKSKIQSYEHHDHVSDACTGSHLSHVQICCPPTYSFGCIHVPVKSTWNIVTWRVHFSKLGFPMHPVAKLGTKNTGQVDVKRYFESTSFHKSAMNSQMASRTFLWEHYHAIEDSVNKGMKWRVEPISLPLWMGRAIMFLVVVQQHPYQSWGVATIFKSFG